MDEMIWKKGSVAGEWLLQGDKACRQISEDGGCGELLEERSMVGSGVIVGKNGTVGSDRARQSPRDVD